MSTFLFILRNRIVDNKKSLEIKLEFPLNFLSEDASLNNGTRMLSITILNKGNIPIFIENPLIKYPRTIDNNKGIFIVNKEGTDKFPYKLEVGEVYRKQESLKHIISILKKDFNTSEKIQIIVKDSLGKRYKSKNISINELERELLKSNKIQMK